MTLSINYTVRKRKLHLICLERIKMNVLFRLSTTS